MLSETLKKIYRRDLEKLSHEISLYKNEKNIWRVDKQITNSAGNLCLHLVGNMNTYIGAVLGRSGYIRNRDLEFSQKDIPIYELIKKVDDTISVVEKVMYQVND